MVRARYNRKSKRKQTGSSSIKNQDELWTIEKTASGGDPKSLKRTKKKRPRRAQKQSCSLTPHHLEDLVKGGKSAKRSPSAVQTVRWLAVEKADSLPPTYTVDSSDEDQQDDDAKIEFFGTGRSPHQQINRSPIEKSIVINMLNPNKKSGLIGASADSSTQAHAAIAATDHPIELAEKEVQQQLGEGPWSIDFVDSLKLLPEKLRRTYESRYFLPTHCQLCKGIDHVTDRCPDQNKQENVVCYLCGDRNHWATKCQFKFCSLCYTIGHFSSHCKNIAKVRAQFCKRCKQRGHVISTCPEAWRQLHSTTSTPSKSNSTPVKLRALSDTRPLSCFICAKSGHVAQQCTAPHLLMHDLDVLNKNITHYDKWQVIESAAAHLEKERAVDTSSAAEKDVRMVTDAIDECLRMRAEQTVMSQLDIDTMRDLGQLFLGQSIRRRVAAILQSADRQQLLDRICQISSVFAKYIYAAFGKRRADLPKKMFRSHFLNFKTGRPWAKVFDRMETIILAAQATVSANKPSAELRTPADPTTTQVVKESAAAPTKVVKRRKTPTTTPTPIESTSVIVTDRETAETPAETAEPSRDLADTLKKSVRAYGQSLHASRRLLLEMTHRFNLFFCKNVALCSRLLSIFQSENQTQLVDRICKAIYGLADAIQYHRLRNVGCCAAKKPCSRLRRLKKLRLFDSDTSELKLIRDHELIRKVESGLERLESFVLPDKQLESVVLPDKQLDANACKPQEPPNKTNKLVPKKLEFRQFKQPLVKQTPKMVAKTAARYTAAFRRKALEPDYRGWDEYVERVEAPGGYLRGTDWPKKTQNHQSTLAGYGTTEPNLASLCGSGDEEIAVQWQMRTLKRPFNSDRVVSDPPEESSSPTAKRSRRHRYNLRCRQ